MTVPHKIMKIGCWGKLNWLVLVNLLWQSVKFSFILIFKLSFIIESDNIITLNKPQQNRGWVLNQ